MDWEIIYEVPSKGKEFTMIVDEETKEKAIRLLKMGRSLTEKEQDREINILKCEIV